MDIVGKNSPVVEGLPVGESGAYVESDFELLSPTRHVYDEDEVNEAIREVRNSPPPAEASTRAAASSADRPSYSISTKKRKRTSSDEKSLLLEEKWKAQTEFLKQQSYNIMLQNFQLEAQLGLPHSELTSTLTNV